MRIKRLDITGFKSFMDRSAFSFGEGVTGVVGPNGCGKSNVVDALRWVMGEQSAKALRGRGMEDVIFNGSESQEALSMAEVHLTLSVDAADGLAPQYSGYPELTVTRRLFRSGESEYLINKTGCRLLDIVELFLGTGVGTRAYSIIEQGRVGLIVSSKPEDRRFLIEEAAGVTKYKSRRRAAERKMEATEANLLRVADLVAELGKRLDTLGRQARKAEKYRTLKARMQQIELHHAAHRWLALAAEQKQLTQRLEALSGTERAAVEGVRALEDAVALERSALDTEAQRLQTLAETAHALETAVQRDAQNLAHWREDLTAAEGVERTSAAELEEVLGQAEAFSARVLALDAELAALSETSEGEAAALRRAQEGLEAVQVMQADATGQLEQQRLTLLGLAARVANHENNLVNLGQKREELHQRHARAEAEAETLRAQVATLERERSEVTRAVTRSRQLTLELAERSGAEEETLARARATYAEHEVAVISLREELADRRSRLHSLEEIQRHYEGFDRGVRAVMRHAAEGPQGHGVRGLVADVVSTSARFEKAVEAALGARLQHVLVEGTEEAFALAGHLRSLAEGRSTFLPLAVQPVPGARPNPPSTVPGVVAVALEQVSTEPAFRAAVEALLGDVLLVEDLASARAVAALCPGSWTCVTLEGEVLGRDGSVTGGVLEGPAVGALQKKREIAELAEALVGLEERFQEAVTRGYALQKHVLHTEEVLKGLQRHHHEEELNRSALEKDLTRAAELLAALKERLSAAGLEAESLHQALLQVLREQETSRGEVAHAQAERAAREESVKNLAERIESLRTSAEAHQAELLELQVSRAAHAERSEAARRTLAEAVASRDQLILRSARLSETHVQAAERAGELRVRIASTASGHEARSAELFARREELETSQQAHAARAARVRAEEQRLRAERASLDNLTDGLSQLTLRERELVLELAHLLDAVRDRHHTELSQELHRFHLLPALSDAAEAELRELRLQVERMGEINLTAIEEHQEVAGRHDFLAVQKRDLESSLAQLRSAIAKIDRTSRDRFAHTFGAVNEKFQAVFPRLFGGGRACLVLVDEAGGAEAGVDIVAQPPGKKLQSVTLLSGGEKALTAVALIFAIFLIKPSPFCVLDEVDAPLDEANVGRYNELVREMSAQSQFILITHNKRTMEVADTLYGVTMEEPGISKLVSVRLRDAAAANDDQAVA
jgi:chromosome segregation protein